MKFLIIVFWVFVSTNSSFAQSLESIRQMDGVYLPVDSKTNDIYFSATFNEDSINRNELKKELLTKSLLFCDSTKFFYITSDDTTIEFFVVYPYSLVDGSSEFFLKELKDGVLTYSFLIYIHSEDYQIVLKDFYWVNKNEEKTPLKKFYSKYKNLTSMKEKYKYFGIIKSAETAIAESLSNFTVVIEDIIQQYSPPLEP